MRPARYSELELELIHALEVNPRVSWSRLGDALGVSPITVRRRWENLTARGAAWMAVMPGLEEMASAVVQIDCAAGSKRSVAEAVAADQPAFTVEITGGRSDLLVTVVTETMHGLQRYVLDRLDAVPGVQSTRTAIVTEWFGDGSQWRVGALSRSKESDVARAAAKSGAADRGLSAVDRELIRALCVDGRASYRDLGEAAGVSATTAARRVERMLHLRQVGLRCETASSLAGWPFHAGLRLMVPPARLREIGRTLIRWKEVRMCVGIAEEANLRLSVWLRQPNELIEFEDRMTTRFPEVVVSDRNVDLVVVKRVGHLLDDGGFSRALVPCAVWAEGDGPQSEGRAIR